ncbi:energy-coupling factor transporter transmembrane component T family protein [Desulfosarcina ovata]|uniref:Cobalt transporter n=1 Tax=Desulfosarcina ovata subsp. ovata TaxID=2752305 RepID=A0A5K8ACN1_9BACT|nr:energy-coupling factor transporter transmembrane component T [Desulfosarcina ovata]BBO90301.1 cobalt transporter [Desulfosarcina ovata subsp. ovata]
MLDPRTKLLLALAYGTLVAGMRQPAHLGLAWGGLVVAIVVLGQLRTYLRWLLMLVPMALFFGAVTAWSADRFTGLAAAMGLLAMTTVFFVFFATTDPEDLGNSLVHSGLPFAAAFVMTAAMQFVPVVARKARAVIETQQARGIVLKPGWRALRNYPALLIPLLVQCFQMADNLAEAMEARGFGRSGRTFRKSYRLRLRDWLAILGGWGAVILAFTFLAH